MIKPLFDNVLLKKVKIEENNHAGIVFSLNDEADSNIGEVIDMGESCLLSAANEGELVAGSKVVFSDNFKKLNYKNEEYFIVNEEEVLAVIE